MYYEAQAGGRNLLGHSLTQPASHQPLGPKDARPNQRSPEWIRGSPGPLAASLALDDGGILPLEPAWRSSVFRQLCAF